MPHADVDVALDVLVDEAVAELVADVLDVGVVVLDVEDDELQAARTPSETAARTATPTRVRQWTDLFICSAFSLANSSEYFLRNGRVLRFYSRRVRPGSQAEESPFTVVHGYLDPSANGAPLHCFVTWLDSQQPSSVLCFF